MELGEQKRVEFIGDVRSILVLQDLNRSASVILEKRMRSMGWKGWNSYSVFVQICRDVGFHVYDGMGKRKRPTHFISLDPAPPAEPDYFRGVGWVVAVRAGVWDNRGRPVGTTTARGSARVWTTRGGVLGYCERFGHPKWCIQSTKDGLDDA